MQQSARKCICVRNLTYRCPKNGHDFGDIAGMPSSRQLRPADIFGEVRIYPAGLAIAPFVLTLLFCGCDLAAPAGALRQPI